MKTKYTQLLNLRQRELKSIEQQKAVCEMEIQNKQNEINKILHEIAKIPMKNSGNSSELMAYLGYKKSQICLMDKANEELSILKEKRMIIDVALKEANKEFEKIKALDNAEIQKIIKLIKDRDNQHLDEINIMLFNNRAKENI